jgi:protein-S-isoprenylcysteine O-methyltransferase Ste14
MGATHAMTPYFVGHSIATVLFVGTLAVWAGIEVRQARKRRTDATAMDRGSRLVIGLCVTGAFVLAALARAKVTAAALPGDAVTFGIGLSIVWTGIGLRWWSFRALGRYFTFDVMTSADQPVITTGPYRIVRHPSYAGLLLVLAGIVIMYANWLSLVVVILLPLIGLMYRIRVEEAALSAALGEAYRSYAASRKRIIPFVW